MSILDINTTVGQLVAVWPGSSRIFERLGIDYCCGGKQPLSEACASRGLDPQAILEELAAREEKGGGQDRDWSEAGLGELCDHIEAMHHA